jgi:hypothetical protein
MAVMQVAAFSDLINRPKDTLAELVKSRVAALLLRRRDAEDLVLTTATRHEQEHAVVTAATRLAVALMQRADADGILIEILPDVFPWVRFLPQNDVRAFLGELVHTLRAADDLDTVAPVAQLITEWRHTAEIYADPDLAAILAQDGDDFGPVSPPEVM